MPYIPERGHESEQRFFPRKMKIHREGTNILVILLAMLVMLNGVAWLFLSPVAIPVVLIAASAVIYGFVFNFFRCPKRNYKGEREGMVVSSVDGKVVVVERVFEPEYLNSEAIQVSVFMSPLNVHANWFPADGRVDYVKHHKGRFLSAYLPKASLQNERATIGMVCDCGSRLTVRQIAGAMARRIVTYARKGQKADINDHLGFIKFGSRVDIFLPVGSEVLVRLGQVTRGGLTPLARLPRNGE